MAWAGKRYDVRLGGYGGLGGEIAEEIRIGPCRDFVKSPLANSDWDGFGCCLTILITSMDGLEETIESCRQFRKESRDDCLAVLLICNRSTAGIEETEAAAVLSDLADFVLRFPYACDVKSPFTTSRASVISAATALIVPSYSDELMDFDFCDLVTSFAGRSGFVSVAEKRFNLDDASTASRFEAFWHSEEIAKHCYGAAVFVSVRGEQPIRFNDATGLTRLLHDAAAPPDAVIASFTRDTSLKLATDIVVTIVAAK